MPKYTDCDALLQRMETRLKKLRDNDIDYHSYRSGFAEACIAVENAPAADVAEVKHGEWLAVIKYESLINPYQHTCDRCCKSYFDRNTFDYPYCPNCGAKMDGKENKDA